MFADNFYMHSFFGILQDGTLTTTSFWNWAADFFWGFFGLFAVDGEDFRKQDSQAFDVLEFFDQQGIFEIQNANEQSARICGGTVMPQLAEERNNNFWKLCANMVEIPFRV